VIGVLLYLLLPGQDKQRQGGDWLKDALRAMGTVLRNPQSILCGMIAGLLFIPTTIFDMIWGVRYLQEARGYEYASAVVRSATVPLGWIVGCPLLGFFSDRLGRRKPVILAGALVLLACLVWILYGPADVLPPYVLGLVAGLASGAAMLPYTVIKEANSPEVSGTATGVVNFLNFTFSALLGPVFGWILRAVAGGASPMTLEHYQTAFEPLLYGVGLAIVLTLVLKETGPAARPSAR
jgi:sugar phosphate permease